MQRYQLSEMDRRLANLIRWGTIEAADYEAARVRVRCGAVVTDWLPWVTARAGGDVSWWAPEVGEQVLILSPSGETGQGVALVGVFQAAHPAPANTPDVARMVFKDGAVIEYDRAAHTLAATIPGDVSVQATGSIDAKAGKNATIEAGSRVFLTAPQIVVEGTLTTAGGHDDAGNTIGQEYKHADTEHTGSYTLQGDMVVTGNVTVNGSMTVTGALRYGSLDPL